MTPGADRSGTAALSLCVGVERWPIRGGFTIARGAKGSADVVAVTLTDASGHYGRGEAVPYARYGESLEGVTAAIEALRPALADGLDRCGLQTALPAGAARAAVDAAFWDLDARRQGRPVWQIADLDAPQPIRTARTIALAEPETMARAAAALSPSAETLLKLKLGRPDTDAERLSAVRAAAPEARLVVDVNEGWSRDDLARLGPVCADHGVDLLEQPLPADDRGPVRAPVPLCADETFQGTDPLATLPAGYDAVNLKLDKAGGLTGAWALLAAVEARGLSIFLGCMVATSLALAPAMMLASRARWVDLDGAWLLDTDRAPGLAYDAAGWVSYPAHGLWGDGAPGPLPVSSGL